MEIPPIAAYGGSVGMTVRVGRRDSEVRQRWQDGRDPVKPRGREALPDLSSRASRASRGISMLESLPPWWKGPCPALKKPYDDKRVSKPSSWRSVGRGRSMACEETNDGPLPPVGSRGRGPWSGRGSQRVKPRLVSPFEKRRLFRKGQGFLRVVCPKAGFYLPRQQRFRVGDPSTRFTRSG